MWRSGPACSPPRASCCPASTQGIFIPADALITDATTNSSQVFLIRDGKARLAVVQVGERDGDLVRILTGIPADAVLATDHLQDLYDGQSVKLAGASATGA